GGHDTVNYGLEGGPQGVRVNLLGSASQGGLTPDTAIDSFGFKDTVTNIGNVIGTKFSDVIFGGNHDNVLAGGAGNDFISGLKGDDTLIGGRGIDTLKGGAGDDVFVFNAPLSAANHDVIKDFSNVLGNDDSFRLDGTVFTKLGAAGPLNPDFFFTGTAAHDA